ncbi:MAG: SDR family oxidoreductase [Burkholderiales bacterium]|nr:SDR family oxidoreductase [Anaerolineae bacterium]
MGSQTGKVAIVTGASRGIGRAIAERLGALGATVVVNYAQNAEKAQEVVQAIQTLGGQSTAIQADIADVQQVRSLFEAAQDQFGDLDILVNNAATALFKPLPEITEAEFDRVFQLNTRGTFFALQEAARRIRDGGRIVNISTAGTTLGGAAGASVYLASKAAVEQFSMALAKELGSRQVTVNTILPGMTRTDGLIMPPQAIEQAVQATPLGRLGEPDDIARAVAFLISDEGGWITGQNIRVSGGL